MSRKKKRGYVTESEKRILKALTKGAKWLYELYPKKGEKERGKYPVGSNKTALQGLKHLNKLGLIELKKELSELRGRKRKFYGLTFKGLVYLVKQNLIDKKEASIIREKNNIEIPAIPMFHSLVVDMEKNYPEIFYGFFGEGVLDLETVTNELLASITTLIGFITFLTLPKVNPQHFKRYIRGKDIVLSDGTVLEDYETAIKLFYAFGKPMFPKWLQESLEQALKGE